MCPGPIIFRHDGETTNDEGGDDSVMLGEIIVGSERTMEEEREDMRQDAEIQLLTYMLMTWMMI